MKNLYGRKEKPLWAHERAETQAAQGQRINLGELLFFASFFAFFLKYTMDISGIITRDETLNSALVGFSIICSVTKILTQRYTPLRFALTMSACAVIGYSSLISINYLFLLGFLLIMGMQDIDFLKIIKIVFWGKTINMSAHVLCYIYVYNTNPSAITFSFRAGTGLPRHFFFMGHANTFSAFLVWTCIEYIFINYSRLRARHLAAIWLINIFFYMFTDSNSGITVLSIVTALIALDKSSKGFFDKPLAFFAKYAYTFLAVFFPFTAAVYTMLDGRLKELWHILDGFLTGRMWYGAYAYYRHGPTLGGRPDMAPENIFWSGRWFDTMTIFDNYYLGNFLSYGYIHLIITALAFIILCGKMENREKIIIIAFILYGIMESYVTNISICFALIIIGKYLYQRKDKSSG